MRSWDQMGQEVRIAAIMGKLHTKLKGEILLDGEDVLEMEVDEHCPCWSFLGGAISKWDSGVTNAEFARDYKLSTNDDNKMGVREFIKLDEKMALLDMPNGRNAILMKVFQVEREKRNEILQCLMIEPSFAILDEINSGLDIDALGGIKGVNAIWWKVWIPYYLPTIQRLLEEYITPDGPTIMMEGRVVMTGDAELAKQQGWEGSRSEELGLHYDEKAYRW